MVHGKNRIPYRIDRRLTGLAGPDYGATISFGLPLEPEDSQYGKSPGESSSHELSGGYQLPNTCATNFRDKTLGML